MAAESRVSDERISSTSGEALIRSFERHLGAENKRPQTIDHYIGASRQFLTFATAENLPSVENITREHIELWLLRLKESYSDATVRNRFIGLRMFFSWLFAEGEIERVLWAFRERVLDLKQDRRFRFILIFKNHGATAGATLEHSHSQLIALPIVPDLVREEIHGARRHFEAKERCVYCDIVRQETAAGRRLILENADMVALAPYAPRFPFETWLLPRRHGARFEEAQRHAPELHRALEPLRRSPRERSGRSVRRAYAAAPSLPIDVAIMERSSRVWTLPVAFRWSDVGTWLSLAEELGVGPGRTRRLDGELLFDDPGGNLVWGDRRGIALLGVEGLAVIDTPEVLLVTKLDRSSDVRAIVARLKTRGRMDVT